MPSDHRVITADEEWDERFMMLAQNVAHWSKDSHRQVGAVIVAQGDRRRISLGYNGFPHGIRDTVDRLTGDVRLKLMCHAEANAMDNASFPLDGATVYTTKAPCISCVLRMANQRIDRVVCPEPDGDKAPDLWDAIGYAREAGIEIKIRR